MWVAKLFGHSPVSAFTWLNISTLGAAALTEGETYTEGETFTEGPAGETIASEAKLADIAAGRLPLPEVKKLEAQKRLTEQAKLKPSKSRATILPTQPTSKASSSDSLKKKSTD
ncbi:hypothetical protein E3N88_38070 [Mikania micrantha]|uniref:Uncharacterized protein n=1 Tax=Mikania micrantha TaxID=192012 RepID=A0A5N6LSY4_9ASTR|nr:hypothetical protein E3N88_38070 [Mikania micrantha]